MRCFINISAWLDEEEKNPHKQKALENASRYFNEKDELNVNLLEAIYAQESSFGKYRRKRNMNGAAGDFQLERQTAKRYGLIVSKNNDQRFDVDNASEAAAKYLKNLDVIFSKESILTSKIKTISISDTIERKKIVIAANNGGEGLIAIAQAEALRAGKNPKLWSDLKEFLVKAGASESKSNEIIEYVNKILQYEKMFQKESKAEKSDKFKEPLKNSILKNADKWITKDGKHIHI
ncbi:MAG: transglycosylase SLT domain-containing protein [Candidatus Margulisiibacteriota bacterium]